MSKLHHEKDEKRKSNATLILPSVIKMTLVIERATLHSMEATSMIMGHNLTQFEARHETQVRIRWQGRIKCRATPFLYGPSILLG
jgi:hypothetical protein